MLTDDIRPLTETPTEAPPTRLGDLAAMLRVMHPLNLQMPDPTNGWRQLLADLCRFIGVKMGTVSPESLGAALGASVVPG